MQVIKKFEHRSLAHVKINLVQGSRENPFFLAKTGALFVPSYEQFGKGLTISFGKPASAFWDPRTEVLEAAGRLGLQNSNRPKPGTALRTHSGNIRAASGGRTLFIYHGIFLTENWQMKDRCYNFSIHAAKETLAQSEQHGLASVAFPLFANSTGTDMTVFELARTYATGAILHLRAREFPSRLQELLFYLPESLAGAFSSAADGVKRALGVPAR